MDALTGDAKSFRFGSFELDLSSRELKKGRSAPVRLQQQPFEIWCAARVGSARFLPSIIEVAQDCLASGQTPCIPVNGVSAR